MDWASNLFIVLLLTDITGTIFYLAGEMFRRLISDDVKVLRFLTGATLVSFLVPFVYVILYAGKRISTIRIESNINLFYNTPLMLELNAVLGCVWIGLFLILLSQRLYRRICWAMTCRGNIPEEDERIFKLFMDICTALGINGEVSLCRNDSVHIPCITYHHGFVVILPLVRYTEKEAGVILYHELCHYLNRDMYFKTVSCIVALLHVFNPVAHILLREIDLLCEKCCDRAACEKGMALFKGNEYFQVILDLLVTDGKRDRYQLFALVDDKSSYERRVEYMADYHKNGGLKKGTALVLSVCFLLGSSFTSLAAGNGVAKAYEGLAETTSVKNEYGEMVGVEGREAEEAARVLSRVYDLNPEDVIIMEDDGIEPYASFNNITWTIPAGKTYMSTGFKQKEGDSVLVTVMGTPDDVVFQTGLKDPDNIMWYVEGSEIVTQEFIIEMDGRHYFFVTNMSEEEELHVDVSLIRQPLEEKEPTEE